MRFLYQSWGAVEERHRRCLACWSPPGTFVHDKRKQRAYRGYPNRFGAFQIPLTLQLLVVLNWGLILDAPHVWATLARTLFDPGEWKGAEARDLGFIAWFFVRPAPK